MTKGVCIIECVCEDDPGSEGKVLKEIFNLMQVKSKLIRVKSIKQLLKALTQTEMTHVHIATHGAVTKKKRFAGWWTHDGEGSHAKLRESSISLKGTTIVSTACQSGSQPFARLLTKELGCKNYIAPTGSPSFYNAALFAHIYYHKLFKTKKSVQKAFDSYAGRYRNPHGFTLFKSSSKSPKKKKH
ncbi:MULTISPECIES: hypothetical protein [Pseudomonas]|nr:MULTISPECIES: hypothetical protein [Pseudomonas]AZC33213.1 hypothetical protein C4K38_5277 [Pseudomonas chlororaphis subsp. piscium]AZC53023.1 hypothetical protein C4K35_5464 [Pseudomonas chlororaphis subsp. piscium]AZC59279.1 hypothetical protein C4K34_5138 [Pseudomonas chlororaphis subsp. piscium]AZC65493.1 hypothetical protein C4K33_5025 [Pseudomonas chlororaphis subsp. piscium]AZC71731.1 hypothetical protein C4K32_5093 [Pseudomonas chlororaphis subsp. piscium]